MNDSTINDGGPAFPITEYGLQGYNGMSLRDWFAGQALAGMLAANAHPAYGHSKPPNCEIAAVVAYKAADAMIEARKPTSPTTP